MNKDQDNIKHLQLNEDMEWSGKVLSYKHEIRDMLGFLEAIAGHYSDEAMLVEISGTCDQLTAQLHNLEEIAHVARSNEFALIAKIHLDEEAANRYRAASRIKEQSLLRFFMQRFEKIREEYSRLYNSMNTRQFCVA